MAADVARLEIRVDQDVHLDAEVTPRPVLDTLRRQLRQHSVAHKSTRQRADLAGAPQTTPPARSLDLLHTEGGEHRLPQALLGRLTDACRRHGVAYEVVDRREMASCPALHCSHELSEAQAEALRRLLRHDSGVLVAPDAKDRQALAAELIARRQQRATVIAATSASAERWRSELAATLGTAATSRVHVLTYEELERRGPAGTSGLLIFDGLSQVEPLRLMRAVRACRARFLLGLASAAARDDELDGPLYLCLGGVVAQLAPASSAAEDRPPRLSYRRRATRLHFDYGGRAQYQALLAALATDDARNQLIADDVRAEAQAGLRCIVLSDRRDHLDQLASRLGDVAVEQLTSTVRPAERNLVRARFDAGQVQVLLATSQIALEAVDRALHAPRLFLAFPFAYSRKLERMVQALLAPSCDALIYDYDDVNVAPLHRACAARAQIVTRLQRGADATYEQWAQLDLDF